MDDLNELIGTIVAGVVILAVALIFISAVVLIELWAIIIVAGIFGVTLNWFETLAVFIVFNMFLNIFRK